MKPTTPYPILALLLALAGPVAGSIGTVDTTPAATLLLPYFEVDLDDPFALTTLFSVANAAPGPAIAHVTLWTDLSVPTLTFNIYLTGYDVEVVNLRDVFNGNVPITDDETPPGLFSLTDNPATGVGPGAPVCDNGLPNGGLPQVLLDHIRFAHTGQPSPAVFGGLCSGIDHGDNIARGHLTLDSVSECTLGFPGDPGYFVAGGQGAANNANLLLGDVIYVHGNAGLARGDTMVHIEASDALGAGDYTFYRRLTAAGEDQREGLATSFWARYAAGGAPDNGSSLIVWRDPKQPVAPFACGAIPPPFPLTQTQIVAFDLEENPSVVPDALDPFPAANNTLDVDPLVVETFGWIYLNLNAAVPGGQVPFGPTMQNWVMNRLDSDGQFSVGLDAFQLDNVLAPLNRTLPLCDGDPDPAGCSAAVVFSDGFESGDTAAWSLTVP